MPTVLVIDDNPAIATALATLLGLHDIDVQAAASPAAGLAAVAAGDIDLVIQDMNFSADTTSGDEGVALFHALRARDADLPVVLLTAWTHLDTAVELVKAGAADYLAKPWDDRKLLACVHTLLELGQARRQLARGRTHAQARHRALAQGFDLAGLVFADPASEAAIALACQVARSELPVLITGPNGAGKERVAQVIHRNSAARGRRMAEKSRCGIVGLARMSTTSRLPTTSGGWRSCWSTSSSESGTNAGASCRASQMRRRSRGSSTNSNGAWRKSQNTWTNLRTNDRHCQKTMRAPSAGSSTNR